jgi:hypothetical protein
VRSNTSYTTWPCAIGKLRDTVFGRNVLLYITPIDHTPPASHGCGEVSLAIITYWIAPPSKWFFETHGSSESIANRRCGAATS